MVLKLVLFLIKDFYHRDMHIFEALGLMQRLVSFLGVFNGWSHTKGGGCMDVVRRLSRVYETRQDYSEADHGRKRYYQLVNKAIAHAVCLFLQAELYNTAEKGIVWHLT